MSVDPTDLADRIRRQSETSAILLRAKMELERTGEFPKAQEHLLRAFVSSEDKWAALKEEQLAQDQTLCNEHDNKNLSEETA